jgi:hypothetical protein
MEIKLINEVWFVNGKPLNELTPNEMILLDQFFENYKNQTL